MKLDIGLKVFFLLLFGSAYFLAIPYPEKARQFPQLIISCCLAFSAASLLLDIFARFRRRSAKAKNASGTTVNRGRVIGARFWKSWLIIIFSTLAGLFGGFLFTALFLLVGFPLVFEGRKRRILVKDLALAVVLTICVYLVFDKLMGVPLLSGLLIDL